MILRIWQGSRVRAVLNLTDDGFSVVGDRGGAEYAARPDIEYDPWAGLVTDYRNGPQTTPIRIEEV